MGNLYTQVVRKNDPFIEFKTKLKHLYINYRLAKEPKEKARLSREIQEVKDKFNHVPKKPKKPKKYIKLNAQQAKQIYDHIKDNPEFKVITNALKNKLGLKWT